MSTNRYSFHDCKKVYNHVATIPEMEVDTKMRHNAKERVPPSMSVPSSSSFGNVLKQTIIIMMENGSVFAKCVAMGAR